MKASELRIGNYVEESVLGVVTVSTIEPELVWVESKNMKSSHVIESSYYHVDMNSITPITLTREWLLKFGFKHHKYDQEYGDMYKMDVIICDARCDLGVVIKNNLTYVEVDGVSLIWKEAVYVHELQNLYFALTGEELTVKE